MWRRTSSLPSSPAPVAIPTPPSRLLLVEDDRRVGSFIVHGLRDEGYTVEWAVNAEAALGHMRSGKFDVVVLDHMLPDRSGIEVARSLRAAGNPVPILMLTARDAPEDRRAAFDAGANEFMGKPFLFEELLNRIQTLLSD